MAREATIGIAYVPFKTFTTALDTLRQGVPDPLDKSVFQNQSFSTQNMLISSLKALGTIDEQGHPQPILARLVNPETRKEALREVIEDKYHAVLALGQTATENQVDTKFREYGVGGETLNKAKAFFFQAAGVVGIPLSPHLRAARIVANGDGEGAPKPTTPRRRRSNKGGKPREEAAGVVATTTTAPRGSTKTVQLSSGGEVTLAVTIDPMELSDADQEWVFGLIKQLRAYEKNGGPPSQTAADGAAES
ncbi:MAG TPA: DUF5343 domain-containing protein [Candidatus Baltobacteraceae bacterium]|nr:DUF5343 domain-containing protein [Candidatus Baltobacteraceae bacterium]